MIPLFKVFMSEEAVTAASKVLRSGFIGQGQVVEEFEDHLKSYFNYPYLITTNSGTSALHLAIHLLKKDHKNWFGISDIDYILASPLTCTASNFPILANGLKLKWVDISDKDLNMDLSDLERKLGYNTKAIVLPYWGGYPTDLAKLEKILVKSKEQLGYKPMVIEDLAHGLGSRYRGKLMGTFGHLSMFSLQAIKHVTSIDGGILMLPNKELYRRAKLLRWYGIDREGDRKDFRCESDIPEWGFKFHMNDVCAAVGMANFKHLPETIAIHQEIAKFYNNRLFDIKDVELLSYKPSHKSAYWLYTIKVKRRDDFIKMMKKKGIATSKVHERNDKHTCVEEFRTELPNLERVVKEMVCIPIGRWVTTADMEYIVDCIKGGW